MQIKISFLLTIEKECGSLTDDLEIIRQQFAEQVGETSNQWVGRQVHDLRKAKRMSLKQLSEAANLSIGLLSQIERGTSSPSLRSLRAISDAVGVSPVWFFNDGKVPPPDERDVVVRKGAGRKLNLPHKKLTKDLVTPDLSGSLQMLIVNIEPGGSTGGETYWHPGEECGFVLEGELELWVGERHFHLYKGDSFRFKSNLPHRSYNPGKKMAHIIWVTSPPFY
ncbi:MAG TPA: Cro/Cl family transcriptional regulator [Rhodospirillaceae bacterium]|nr:Cro/Cl family transcriptional regulator [Rhodospirillaceae bacterium]MAX63170.1 Cro/Cl family transcriptional regulator [Rhodospirillaceae bacterium]MAX65125.1 Cro/Cl family transcriptional regulator [Rhodospirillaceae bacterium]MBB59411.1 Cro/Cl family transcriptional regulator [Rhodospirillaceae bacterium]HAE02747.1 Cro/Cl family transcriptional regulator [Rhodospirillaceae bacterium]